MEWEQRKQRLFTRRVAGDEGFGQAADRKTHVTSPSLSIEVLQVYPKCTPELSVKVHDRISSVSHNLLRLAYAPLFQIRLDDAFHRSRMP